MGMRFLTVAGKVSATGMTDRARVRNTFGGSNWQTITDWQYGQRYFMRP